MALGYELVQKSDQYNCGAGTIPTLDQSNIIPVQKHSGSGSDCVLVRNLYWFLITSRIGSVVTSLGGIVLIPNPTLAYRTPQ